MIKLKKHILLLGFMGSGKSTLTKLLAIKLNCRSIDLDTEIENNAGKSIREIFEKEGEDSFRKTEADALNQILEGEPQLIALGGGTPCQEKNSKQIFHSKHVSVYLKYDPSVLAKRLIKQRQERPLLKNYGTLEELSDYIETSLETRSIFYEQADFIIHNEMDIEQSIQLILNYLKFANLIDQ